MLLILISELESKEYNCTIFIYLDKDDNVISMNFHWGTMTINPKYMEFNGDGEVTQLYRLFLKILGSHSPKIYDMVISACSLNTPKDFKIKLYNYQQVPDFLTLYFSLYTPHQHC